MIYLYKIDCGKGMNDLKKFIFCFLSFVMFLESAAFAEVLGTPTGGWMTDMGANTYLHNTSFDSGAARQNEYYVEYTPNGEAVPVVINGDFLWGTRTIRQASEYMENNGLRPLVGINADYFSFKTGIPMGTSVMNGEIATSSAGYIDAIGFRSDGSGFIRGLNLKTTVYHGSESANVECINKWYTKDYTPIAIITDKFGKTTKTSSECLFLICTPIEGSLSIGKTVTMTVDDKFEYNGEIAIPSGKIILIINKTGYESDYSFLNSINVGETISVENTAIDDSENIWKTAEYAVGTSAGRLIKNGEIGSGFEAGSAPRTAVGVKENGNIIFYVLDGRQSGYSAGATSVAVAKRLREIGCVDALNLDGGGSTALAGVFPASDEIMVINRPSDGYLRSCANYLFLKDNRQRTDIPKYVVTDNVDNKNFIDGTSTRFNITAVYDTSNYKMNGFGDIEISLENGGAGKSYIDDDNVIHFYGEGEATVNVKRGDDIIYSEQFASFERPENIKIYDQDTWKEISEIYCGDSDEYSIDLAASPVVNGIELNTQDNAYEWSVVGSIGKVDKNGVFTLSRGSAKAGKIVVEKGGFKKEINVYLSGYDSETENGFEDIANHWAKGTILIMADEGKINGYEEDGKRYFKPDAYMTRAEFTKMVCVFAGLDAGDYSNRPLLFKDSAQIPLWAQNYVKAMADSGIISGRSNDDGTFSFAAYDNITRAEAMTVIGRILEDAKYTDTAFADNDDIPLWARKGIGKLFGMGMIKGYSDNTIHPNDNIKRAEAAVLLYNLEH